jgi:hypothetical protein
MRNLVRCRSKHARYQQGLGPPKKVCSELVANQLEQTQILELAPAERNDVLQQASSFGIDKIE